MDPNSTLRETHDISQELQDKLELLPGVERCYIHCDFETEHKPEHAMRIKAAKAAAKKVSDKAITHQALYITTGSLLCSNF